MVSSDSESSDGSFASFLNRETNSRGRGKAFLQPLDSLASLPRVPLVQPSKRDKEDGDEVGVEDEGNDATIDHHCNLNDENSKDDDDNNNNDNNDLKNDDNNNIDTDDNNNDNNNNDCNNDRDVNEEAVNVADGIEEARLCVDRRESKDEEEEEEEEDDESADFVPEDMSDNDVQNVVKPGLAVSFLLMKSRDSPQL